MVSSGEARDLVVAQPHGRARDVSWIATVDPAVGLLLADLLDICAREARLDEQLTQAGGKPSYGRPVLAAVALADAIAAAAGDPAGGERP